MQFNIFTFICLTLNNVNIKKSIFAINYQQMNLKNRVKAFDTLGTILQNMENKSLRSTFDSDRLSQETKKLNSLVKNLHQQNGWFSPDFVSKALISLGKSLNREKLEKWVAGYHKDFEKFNTPKTVAVVMAGNVPAVGFHDFLSVLISGHRILAKLSSDDDKLMPALAAILTTIEPEFKDRITFTSELLKNFDAVIATGSNNSARYFEYYFGKYPNIIRKNRNGVALLSGSETRGELNRLADDIFLYYGMGCRNVARLFVPDNYDFTPLLDVLASRTEVIDNNKYYNNYEYNKAIFLVNSINHFDTGNLLLTENEQYASPVSVLHYSYYQTPETLKNEIMVHNHQIQRVVTNLNFPANKIAFGQSQSPELWDYADGVDTLQFLLNLS